MQWRTMILAATLAVATPAMAQQAQPGETAMSDDSERALVIVTSPSLQTQGMAMILANAMQQQGSQLNILLCDAAGDLALESHASEPLAPKGATPEGLMQKMMEEGAQVQVCAIYLPNSEYGEDDLREGVSVAAPGPIAEMMRDPKVPTFTF
jgi:predicted peroxiredoxin